MTADEALTAILDDACWNPMDVKDDGYTATSPRRLIEIELHCSKLWVVAVRNKDNTYTVESVSHKNPTLEDPVDEVERLLRLSDKAANAGRPKLADKLWQRAMQKSLELEQQS